MFALTVAVSWHMYRKGDESFISAVYVKLVSRGTSLYPRFKGHAMWYLLCRLLVGTPADSKYSVQLYILRRVTNTKSETLFQLID